MAFLFADDFDSYTTWTTDAPGWWDSASPSIATLTTTTPFSAGKALSTSNSAGAATNSHHKDLGSNESVIFILAHFRLSTITGASEGFCIQLTDGLSSATPQVTLSFKSDGTIVVRSGNTTGTVQATSTVLFTSSVFAHLQIKVTIHNTTGRVQIRKDGASSDTWDSGATLNTRGGTSTAQANRIGLGYVTNAPTTNPTVIMDDLFVYSGSGAVPNDWIGVIRGQQLVPNVDTAQKDFTPSPATATLTGTAFTNTTATPIAANEIRFCSTAGLAAFTVVSDGYPASFKVLPVADATGHFKAALYDNDGPAGAPGTLLATSDELTSLTAGVLAVFTFSTPVLFSAGDQFWPCVWGDAAFSLGGTAGVNAQYQKTSVTYTGSFPAPILSLTSNGALHLTANQTVFTRSNFNVVGEAVADGDTTNVQATTVGAKDRYGFADLSVTPANIYVVQVRQVSKKTDAGQKQSRIQGFSGSTSFTSSTFDETPSYAHKGYTMLTDPDTGLAWTQSGVSNITAGPEVVI